MRRLIKFVFGLLLVLVIAVGALLLKTFLGNMPLVGGVEVVPGVTVVKDGYVAAYIVDVGRKGVALIDCGNSADAGAILSALRQRRLDANAVQAIFLTHGHPDHTGGCGAFPNAKIYAGAAELPLIEGRAASHGPLPMLFGAKDSGLHVTRDVEDGEVITVDGVDFHAYAVPGHTAGSVVWLARRVLFFGDSATATDAGALIGAPWLFSDNQAENVHSLAALARTVDQKDVEKMAFGHSGPVLTLWPLTAFASTLR